MELAVAVDGRVVEVALALGEGEQGDQGEGPSSSVGRLCLCFRYRAVRLPGLPRSNA